MMNTGILITARLGSTRLNRKHLLCINNQPILYVLIRRLLFEFKREIDIGSIRLIIVTADEIENRDFENLINESPSLSVFYGSKHNIPLRHLQAAKDSKLDNMISIDGDDILCSVRGSRKVYEGLLDGRDFIKTSKLPFGMNSFGYARNFLEASLRGHTSEILETGWGRIFDEKSVHEIEMNIENQDPRLRFTLDYPEDFEFFKAIIGHFNDLIYTVSDNEIVAAALSLGLYRLNERVNRAYWKNFRSNIRNEVNINELE